MGTRHHSLEMTDVEDVAELIANFNQQNGVITAVALSVVGEGKNRTLLLNATAFLPLPDNAVVAQLASANATCSDMRVKSLGAALTHLLYMLDGSLAENELAYAGIPRA